MTKITITNNEITIEGHANYDIQGKDIVCAVISGWITFIIRQHNLDYDITGSIVSKIYKVPNKTLDTFRELIKELAAQYPENVKIEQR
jgi:uncharacterized protein YsxB (DUF464 family)